MTEEFCKYMAIYLGCVCPTAAIVFFVIAIMRNMKVNKECKEYDAHHKEQKEEEKRQDINTKLDTILSEIRDLRINKGGKQ